MLKHDDELYEDFYSGDTDDWFDGDRFCMKSDFCRFMGPEDGYNKIQRLGRLLVVLILLGVCCGCCGQHYWYKKQMLLSQARNQSNMEMSGTHQEIP